MSLQPYHILFPDNNDDIMTLRLDKKLGKVPKGDYGLIEYYCTDKGCDCRCVAITVVNSKFQTKAAIVMGFDLDAPFPGPFLDDSNPQSPFAEQLLELFTESINDNTAFLELIYRHYREVRTKVDGRKYRGRPFPKPGSITRVSTAAPEITDELLDELVKESRTRKGNSKATGLQGLFDAYLMLRKNNSLS